MTGGLEQPSILLLTRHYPPAVSGGARRPFLLAQGLRRAGARVYVVAPQLPEGEEGLCVPRPQADPAIDAGPPRFDPRNLARELLLWPDPDIRWSLRAARQALAAPPAWRPDWVLSTSPPESIHVAGRQLARGLGARWAMDFRDHWLVRPHRRERLNPLRRTGERLIAAGLMRDADLVFGVDPEVVAELVRLGARDARVLPHLGPSAETVGAATPTPLAADRLHVVHTGSFSLSDPETRIEELLTLFETARAERPELHLHLAGRLSGREVAAIQAMVPPEAVTLHGVLRLEEALALQRAADALAFVGSSKTHVPPSKVIEYRAVGAPIVAIGSGPWRTPELAPWPEPLSVLRSLGRRSASPPGEPIFDPDAAAAMLLGWMRQA